VRFLFMGSRGGKFPIVVAGLRSDRRSEIHQVDGSPIGA
jgi:hypothetical protein